MKEKTFLDIFLEYQMKSSEGEETKSALDITIAEEEQCIELFKFQITHCKQQIDNVDNVIAVRGANTSIL